MISIMYDWTVLGHVALETLEAGGRWILVKDDGFLPEGYESILTLFLYGNKQLPFKPLYFNQVPVPPFFDIQGSHVQGEIFYRGQKRGNIRYTDTSGKRWVQSVEWLSPSGRLERVDFYNQYGLNMHTLTYSTQGLPELSLYKDHKGRVRLVMDQLTGSVMVHDLDGRTLFVESLQAVQKELFASVLAQAGEVRFIEHPELRPYYQQAADIVYPYPTVTELPAGHTYTVFHPAVQEALGESARPKMDFAYPFQAENTGRASALVFTATSEVPGLATLVAALPEVQFHIATTTKMADPLKDLARFEHVTLYPAVTEPQLADLYRDCDLFLDIAQGVGVPGSVYRAFLHKQVILALAEAKHGPDFTLDVLTFTDLDAMVPVLQEFAAEPGALKQSADVQQFVAGG